MKYDERLIRTLQATGLTFYGAKAYCALVALGPSGASSVAEEAGIPRSKIYDVLKRMSRDGWVSTVSVRPLKYRARDPREALVSRREALVEEIETAASELQMMYDGAVEKEPPNAWMVRGPTNIAARVGDMMRRTREEALFIGALYLEEELDVLRRLAPDLRRRRVNVRVLTPESMRTERGTVDLLEGLSPLTPNIRVMRTPMIKFIVVDGREIMIMFSLVAGDVPDLEKSVAIWMPRSEVATLMRSNFLMMWDGASEL